MKAAVLPVVVSAVRTGTADGGMLTGLATFTVRRPKLVLFFVAILLGVSIVFGTGVIDKLGVGGYNAPDSESTHAADFMDQEFGTTANLVIQVAPKEDTVEDPKAAAVAKQVKEIVEAEPDTKVTKSFTDPKATELRSLDNRSGLMLVHVGGTADNAADITKKIVKALPADPDVEVRAGGQLGVQQEVRTKLKNDIKVSESVALPVSLVVLVIVFGGLVAALLPIVIGLTSIITTFLVLLLASTFTEVSTHALTVATAFGLGLSIDFGLLMVSRYREERDSNGREHEAAIIATVATAGRTILFSAATVTLAMCSLLVFPTYFLRSVGITASATVMLSALGAIIVLPALLALLGKRLDSLSIIRRKTQPSADSAFWRRFAAAVIKRPVLYSLPVVLILLGLGIPFMNVEFGNPDERALPTDSKARTVAESLQNDYEYDPSQAITLVTRSNPEVLEKLATEVSGMHDVKLVEGPVGTFKDGRQVGPGEIAAGKPSYATVYLSVQSDAEPALNLVREIRDKVTDQQVEVGGPSATLIDSRAAIAAKLPWAITLITIFTFVLLFLFTGSIVVPAKALLLNVLVLSGVLGVMVWIFQEGHFASALGITPAPLNLSMVVLLCAIAFSLSVDYEIFLLSRIKEARDQGMSNDDAIVAGLGRVGRIVTSAALLLTITLVSFANGMSFMKMFGIGTALAVVIDATIIRAVVVPAFLRLAGEWNWWAPKPLRWLHSRVGISEALSFEVDEATADKKHSEAAEIAAVIGVPAQDVSAPAGPTPVELARRVEVVAGNHLVANVNGTVIVVASRGSVSHQAVAAKQMTHLVEIVKRTDPAMLSYAFSQLINSATWTRDLAELGIVMPTPEGLEIFLCGGVTVALDDGTGATFIEGRNRCLYQSVKAPAVAAVVTVDELGKRPAVAPANRNTIFSLPNAGIVPGQGAVVWSTDAESAPSRTPAIAPRGRLDEPTVTIGLPKQFIVLDDDSVIQIDRDCVIGRDPQNSNAATRGLRPIRIDDPSGQMSRAHFEIRVFNGELLVVDRNSLNGLLMRDPGAQDWTRLTPWQPVAWQPGTALQVGGRTMYLHTPGTPLPSQRPKAYAQPSMSR